MKKYYQKNRIIFIIGSMGKGGAERVISILANYYASKNWEVYIAMLLDNKVEYVLNESIHLYDLSNNDKSRLLQAPFWIKSLRKIFIDLNPDSIISFIARINIITLLSSFGCHDKVLVSERSDPRADGRGLFTRILIRNLYPAAKKVIFQTYSVKSVFSKKIQKNSVVIRNPIEVNDYSKTNKTNRIVSVGRLVPEKNHSLLIEAFSTIAKKYTDYELVIYGEGINRTKLESLIIAYGLVGRVHLPGVVSDVHKKIANAEIFVLTSNHEGLPNALLEAMMLGLPCISTEWNGYHEILNSDNSITIRLNDIQQLIEAIVYLITNKSKAKELGDNAKFSVEAMRVDKILRIWEEVIEMPKLGGDRIYD